MHKKRILLEDHLENVWLMVLDPNYSRFFCPITPQQISEIVTGSEQINLGAVHQLQM